MNLILVRTHKGNLSKGATGKRQSVSREFYNSKGSLGKGMVRKMARKLAIFNLLKYDKAIYTRAIIPSR